MRRFRVLREVLAVVAIVAIGFVLASHFDLFERYADWSRQHESYNVDELVMAAVLGIAVLAIFGWRRYSEARQESVLRLATELHLADTTERYRSLFDYHPDAVFSLDLEGRFVHVNAAAVAITGYPTAELMAMHFADLVHPDDLERTATAFVALLDRQPQHIEVRVRRRDGALIDVEVTGLPVVVGDEVVGAYGIGVDVTERNRLQVDLEQARRAAEEASEAKSLFLANMSHEIRTPLTSVLAAGELLSDTVTDEHEARLIATMRRAGSRLLRLVDDILDFSRVEAGQTTLEHELLDLRQLLEEVSGPARAAAEAKGLTFSWQLEPTQPPPIVGDPGRLAQVVGNLLDNAVKFTDSGQVRLDVRVDGQLEIRVADSGIGMTPDQADAVFESFRQADPSITRQYGGTGLGLAICRQLVELMGGTIDLTSEPGAGTTFVVRLPLAPPQPAAGDASLTRTD